MWINLIGLLSGVIAVCSPREHWGKWCSPCQHCQAPLPLDLGVITGTVLTQDTHSFMNTSGAPNVAHTNTTIKMIGEFHIYNLQSCTHTRLTEKCLWCLTWRYILEGQGVAAWACNPYSPIPPNQLFVDYCSIWYEPGWKIGALRLKD